MLILAFDTSSHSGSIALVRDGGVVAELTAASVSTHSEWLMASVDSLLKSADLNIKDVDLFAVATGPGSFTGLRIGVATVKGLAWSLGKRVAGVSTLEALAMNLIGSDRLICPVLDARKGEVYSAFYRFSDRGAERVIKESVMPPEELFKAASGPGSPVTFLGPGLKTYGEAIRNKVKDAIFASEDLWHIRASNVASLALKDASALTDPSGLVPMYLRQSEAEIKAPRQG